jgi:SAM-dependent methyltransferase
MVSFVDYIMELRRTPPRDERRSEARLRLHYCVERRLADQLRAAKTPDERRAIFATMYDELFRLVPDHPRLQSRDKAQAQAERAHGIDWDMAQLDRFLAPGCVFLEIGAGDCALSSRVARRAARVYAVDICDQTTSALPDNVQLVLSDGREISVPDGSVDVAFSDQLMEHLHPEDAAAQLACIHRALKRGGVYVCITPNRLYGPSDISAYFDDEARGFHLREYTVFEVRRILREAGFSSVKAYVGARGFFVRFPVFLLEAIERALDAMPVRVRRKIADNKMMRALLGVRVAATK